jgi:hypothetical protein
MIAKFNSAEDLLAHYATVRARIGAPTKGPTINWQAMQVKKKKEKVAEVKEKPAPVIAQPVVRMPAVPINPNDVRITFEEVVSLVCLRTGYHRREIFAPRRKQDLCFSRQLAWALARKFCNHMSLPQIGRASGGKDHTTILHGCKKGVKHPAYQILNDELEEMYNQKFAANLALIEQAELEKEGV